jgi:hypothetical protein
MMVDECIKALLEEVECMDLKEDEQLGLVETDQFMVDKSP